MKKHVMIGLAALGMASGAFAAEPPAGPEKCCCEKAKEEGKPCCSEKDKAGHGDHAEHGAMEHGKS